ncbi:hypothetical protein V2J09_023700 [Rumex salicifolius]
MVMTPAKRIQDTRLGGEPDLTTAAKMALHDWQRGKIPFFVPPPQEEENASAETGTSNVEGDKEDEKSTSAMKAIADVVLKDVPVQEDLYTAKAADDQEDLISDS